MDNRSIMISVGVGAVLLIWAVVFLPSSSDEKKPPHVAQPTAEANEPAAPAASPPADVEPSTSARPEHAPAAPAAAPAPPANEPQAPPAQWRPEKMGPFEELKATYDGDGRDVEAGATEERIRTLLKKPEVPEGMLRNVSCVKSVCKLDLRWTSNDMQAYMTLMMLLVSNVSQKLAAAPIDADEGQPTQPLEVYVSRTEAPLAIPKN